MKIAFLSFYSGQIDRGVEVAVAALAQGLSKHHEVTVFQGGLRTIAGVATIQLAVGNNWPTDTSESWLRPFYLDYYSRKILQFTLKFLPYFIRHRYDVVIPTNGGWQVVFCRLTSWLLGKKLVVQGNAGIGFDDLFQLHCFADYYIAISPQGYVWARKFVPWVKKTYIPYGVDLKKFAETKPVVVSLKKPIVLCVAAFSPYKRIELLIRAMQRVAKVSLLVIGQGPLERELRILGSKLLGDRFQLKTGVTHTELIGYYKTADLFSLPSRASEAFGIVYVEAMAAGLPVVATDDHNRREIIGEAGIFVKPENTEEYAKAIELALAKDFGDKAQKQAEKFGWEKIVEKYESLLDSL